MKQYYKYCMYIKSVELYSWIESSKEREIPQMVKQYCKMMREETK